MSVLIGNRFYRMFYLVNLTGICLVVINNHIKLSSIKTNLENLFFVFVAFRH